MRNKIKQIKINDECWFYPRIFEQAESEWYNNHKSHNSQQAGVPEWWHNTTINAQVEHNDNHRKCENIFNISSHPKPGKARNLGHHKLKYKNTKNEKITTHKHGISKSYDEKTSIKWFGMFVVVLLMFLLFLYIQIINIASFKTISCNNRHC
jgi:Fe2+ transport system protein B